MADFLGLFGCPAERQGVKLSGRSQKANLVKSLETQGLAS
jgi:hypothetical protein